MISLPTARQSDSLSPRNLAVNRIDSATLSAGLTNSKRARSTIFPEAVVGQRGSSLEQPAAPFVIGVAGSRWILQFVLLTAEPRASVGSYAVAESANAIAIG